MTRLVGVTLFPKWHNTLERSNIQQHRLVTNCATLLVLAPWPWKLEHERLLPHDARQVTTSPSSTSSKRNRWPLTWNSKVPSASSPLPLLSFCNGIQHLTTSCSRATAEITPTCVRRSRMHLLLQAMHLFLLASLLLLVRHLLQEAMHLFLVASGVALVSCFARNLCFLRFSVSQHRCERCRALWTLKAKQKMETNSCPVKRV